jgi:ketosteroid isomerase-like protein
LTGKGQPNTSKVTAENGRKVWTIHEVVARFDLLAKQEKWFEIHDEFFAEDVKSIEPANSPYLKNAEGKSSVRKKGEDFVNRIETVHRVYTTDPVVAGNHFTVGREMDLTVKGLGRIQINELMVYEVKDGKIVLEQFFY